MKDVTSYSSIAAYTCMRELLDASLLVKSTF